jgi:hypothetical protein
VALAATDTPDTASFEVTAQTPAPQISAGGVDTWQLYRDRVREAIKRARKLRTDAYKELESRYPEIADDPDGSIDALRHEYILVRRLLKTPDITEDQENKPETRVNDDEEAILWLLF